MKNIETTAKALEIAISLVKDADYTWIKRADINGKIRMKEPLYSAFTNVLDVIYADDLGPSGTRRVIPWDNSDT
jgi:hypothetical protein